MGGWRKESDKLRINLIYVKNDVGKWRRKEDSRVMYLSAISMDWRKNALSCG